MRFAAPALALLLGACFEENRTIEVDVDDIALPMGAGKDVSVWVDGYELEKLDAAFSWVVDRPELVTVALTPDRSKVRITGRQEGFTTVHLGYRTSVIDIPTVIRPPAVLGLAVEPTEVTTSIGTMVPVRATATMTTGQVVDVSATTVWVIDDTSIATLDANGVRGTGAGTTTLHAFIDGTQRTAPITIAAP